MSLAMQCRKQLEKAPHSITGNQNISEQIAMLEPAEKSQVVDLCAPLIRALNHCRQITLVASLPDAEPGIKERSLESIRGVCVDAVYEFEKYAEILRDEAGE